MKKNILSLLLFISISTILSAQVVNCVAPVAGTPQCYQTSRVVSGTPNPLWNWTPLPHQDCCNAISLCKPRNEVLNGVLIPQGAPTGTPFYPGCVQDELPDDANTCFSNNEKATTWYKFVITPRPNDDTAIGSYAGKLRFKILPKDIYLPGTINPIPAYPGDALDQGTAGYGMTDYDYLLFKVTDAAGSGDQCSAIKNSTAYNTPGSVIVRCNFTGTRGPTGLFEPGVGIDAAGTTVPRFNAPLDVNVGDVFYLAIDNFTVNQQGFYVDFRSRYDTVLRGRYANDDPTARVGSVDVRKFNITTTKLPACGIEKVVLNFDLAIDCDSITTSSFKVLGPNPPYVITSVQSQNCVDGKDTSFIFSIETSKKDTVLTLVRNRVVRDFCGNTLLTDSVLFRLALPDSNFHSFAEIQPICDISKINIRLKHKVLCDSITRSPFNKFKILRRSDSTEYCTIKNISRTFGACGRKTMDSLYTITLSKEAIDTANLAIYIDSLTATTILDSCGDYILQEGFIPFDILPVKIPFQIVNKPNCGDAKINIAFGKKVRCDSVKLGKLTVRVGSQKENVSSIQPTRGTCPTDGLDSLYTINLQSIKLASDYSVSIDSGVVIRDKCGNPAFFATKSFVVQPFLGITGIADTVCPGTPVRLQAKLDTAYKGALTGIQFTWRDNTTTDTLMDDFSTTLSANATLVSIRKETTSPIANSYTLFARNRSNGCRDTATISVLFSPFPDVEIFDKRFGCFGEIVNIRPQINNGVLDNFVYTWTRIGNPNKIISTDSILSLGVSDSLFVYGLTQKYQLNVAYNKELGGCKALLARNVDLIIGRKIETKIGLIPNDTLASIVPADFTYSNLSKFTPNKNTPYFLWNFGTGGVDLEARGYGSQNFRYNDPGKFWIKLTAFDTLFRNSNDPGRVCKSSDSVQIFVQNLIPSLVTSNGDGKNDFLSIQGMRPNTFSMKLYNRWGKLVGEQDPLDDVVGWDPKDVGSGNYYYILTEKRSGKTLVSWLTISKDK